MSDSAMHVDPKSLREFADELANTATDYKKYIESLDASLARLGSSWRDQEFAAFSTEVKKTQRVLEQFVHEAAVARRVLLEDADRAEAYQRISRS